MPDENKTATATEPETGPGPTAEELAERAAGKSAELAEVYQLLQKLGTTTSEHADAMSRLYSQLDKDVAAQGESLANFRRQLGGVAEQLATLEARVGSALVRLGVEQSAPPAPATPANAGGGDLVFDGANWVPGPPRDDVGEDKP